MKPKIFTYFPTPSDKITKEDLALQVEVIMQNFDFAKVHDMMTKTDWKWVSDSSMSSYGVPSMERIRNTALIYLLDVVSSFEIEFTQDQHWAVGSGGFMAEYIPNCGISLKFVFEEWGGF